MNRTMLGVLFAFATVTAPLAAPTDDYGPRSDVRALRTAASVLLAKDAQDDHLGERPSVDGVVVSGNAALLQWHAGRTQRLGYFNRCLDTWWLTEQIWIDPVRGSAMGPGGWYSPGDENGPTAAFLSDVLKLPVSLADVAAVHLSTVRLAMERAKSHPGPSHFHGDGYVIDSLRFDLAVQSLSPLGGYDLTVRFGANDAPGKARLTNLSGRAPTDAESWIAPGGNSFFFFSGLVASGAPVHIAAGTTVSVWFPFILERSRRYSLAMTQGRTVIGPTDGRLDAATNTVQFTLPAFTLLPNIDLTAEVEGDELSAL